MNQSNITIVLRGNTYSLRSDQPQSMRDMPREDRESLIHLLDALKRIHENSERRVEDALARSTAKAPPEIRRDAAVKQPPMERMGEGDIDQLMARLALEEQNRAGSRIKPATIYKVAGVILVLIILLTLF